MKLIFNQYFMGTLLSFSDLKLFLKRVNTLDCFENGKHYKLKFLNFFQIHHFIKKFQKILKITNVMSLIGK